MFVFASERSLARKQFKCENTHSPLVNRFVVGFLVDELGSHIVNRATEGSPPLVDCMRGPPKVTQFDVHSFQVCYEYIFRLNVSMDHISFLQIQQGIHHLINNVPGFVFAETLLPSQFLVQISVSAILEHHIDVLGVVEVAVETHDVCVI